MANPKINTITDVFLPTGFGFGGFGFGGFGGTEHLVNPQWNTNSGSYYVDPISGLAAVEATASPSFIGAALYTAEYSSFFAKITPAPTGNGSVQTSLLIKYNDKNYVQMGLGLDGTFQAFGVNDTTLVYTSSPMPVYDPVQHAFWRIRNDDKLVFHFDVSPDAITWTELGNVPYYWDASNVTVILLAGFTGSENPGNLALISSVNVAPGLQLSATTYNSASINGALTVTNPFALSATVSAVSNLRGQFTASLGIPSGGMTDFAVMFNTDNHFGNGQADPMSWNTVNPIPTQNQWQGGASFTQSSWKRDYLANTVSSPYRDGTYWPETKFVSPFAYIQPANTNADLMTHVQVELTPGTQNRLDIDSSIYLNTINYTPLTFVNDYIANANTVIRSKDFALSGGYSGKLHYGGTGYGFGTGPGIVTMAPTKKSLVPLKKSGSTLEGVLGSVWLNTSRTNAQWFAALVFYDANYAFISGTYSTPVTNFATHPGSNVWQQHSTIQQTPPSNAAYVAVVPAVILSSISVNDNFYISNHFITGVTPYVSNTPTTYTAPRQAQVTVAADRVNYAASNVGSNFASSWQRLYTQFLGGTSPTISLSTDNTVGFPTLGSLKVVISATGNTSSTSRIGVISMNGMGSSNYPLVQGLTIGKTYTISAYVLLGTGCPDVSMKFLDANGVGSNYVSVLQTKANNPSSITTGGWVRVSTTYTVQPTNSTTFFFDFSCLQSDLQGHMPATFWIDGILVEEGSVLNDYFDGSFTTTDYKWEVNSPTYNAKSFYYGNWANKVTRINSAMSNVLPVSETYNLLFAQPIN